MKILAIDSSGLVATVAIMEDDSLIAEYTVNNKMTHSQTLLPMMEQIFSMTGMSSLLKMRTGVMKLEILERLC